MLHLGFLLIHRHQVKSSTVFIWRDRSIVPGKVFLILRDYILVTAIISMG